MENVKESIVVWKEAQPRVERKVLSTVFEEFKDTKPNLIKSNFNATPDSDGKIVNVMLVFLKEENGKVMEANLTCSSKLSRLLRNGEVSKDNLAGFPICEATTWGGENFKQIQMPTDPNGGLINIGAFTKVEAYQVEAVTAEDLISI